MLSYKYDLSLIEQTKLDALIDGKDMENKVILLIDDEFEIVNKEMFDKMNYQVFDFEMDAGETVKDFNFCELTKQYAGCGTLIFDDNTVYHVDMQLAICIYNGEFEKIILDNYTKLCYSVDK